LFAEFRKVKGFIQKWQLGKLKTETNKQRWEEDYELLSNQGLFEEYLEMS